MPQELPGAFKTTIFPPDPLRSFPSLFSLFVLLMAKLMAGSS
jgi:hypothetical protein